MALFTRVTYYKYTQNSAYITDLVPYNKITRITIDVKQCVIAQRDS